MELSTNSSLVSSLLADELEEETGAGMHKIGSKADCASPLLRLQASKITELQKDSDRLDWVLSKKTLRVQGNDQLGWFVMDVGDGLSFVVRHANTSREAIDAAMKLTA